MSATRTCAPSAGTIWICFGRVLSIRNQDPHPVDPALDLAWTEYLDLVVGTHPALPKEQQKAVELDYKMRGGRLRIPVRAALATYLMRGRQGEDPGFGYLINRLPPTSPRTTNERLAIRHTIETRRPT